MKCWCSIVVDSNEGPAFDSLGIVSLSLHGYYLAHLASSFNVYLYVWLFVNCLNVMKWRPHLVPSDGFGSFHVAPLYDPVLDKQ